MEEEIYMRRCIELARNGLCRTAPNPMVGAVIVCGGKVIGEGYHACCGKAHAEANAIRAVKDPALLRRSTLYVSLEPCTHYGKTPPCADLIIEKQIPRIVVGCADPSDKVDGRGIRKLREAGLEVVVGVLEQKCRQLACRFITFHTLRRPYVTLKWAESADGYIGRKLGEGAPVVLSSPLTAMLTHKRRAEHSAILVGRRTALSDNPRLTVREWYGSSPVRAVIGDISLFPSSLHLFNGEAPTLAFTSSAAEAPLADKVETIRTAPGQPMLPWLLATLHERGLQSLLVEGGGILLQSFIDAGLWDEIFIEKSPRLLSGGVKAPAVPAAIPYGRETWFGREYRHYAKP